MSTGPDAKTAVFRDRLLELGFLEQHEVRDAFQRYIPHAHRCNFGSFLLQRGMLSLSQLAELTLTFADTDSASVTPIEEEDNRVGQVFSGCVVERLIARGGMGSVYLARSEADDSPRVVKFLAKHLVGDAQLNLRFVREGKVLAKLPEHPNLVRVYSMSDDSEQPHIVLEYVEGLTLEKALEERWSLPWEEAVRITRDIARGLGTAHDHGIVHRDIKPANVIVTRSGLVKVVDFGLAKDMFATALTRPGTRLGTPYYMAPEQWGDHEMDARCDVFSLGATLYHLLVGEPPFLGKDSREVGERIVRGEFTPPRRIVSELPEDLELVLFQMLQADRRFRYPSIGLCAQDLERVVRREPIGVPSLEIVESSRRLPLLPGRRFVLGRGEDCDHIVEDPSCSRKHLGLAREEDGFVLRDLNSTFGTYVDGMRISRPLRLKTGDTIHMGKVQLRYRYPWPVQRNTGGIQDVERLEVPAPILQGLIGLNDRRGVASLIERLQPDPHGDAVIRQRLIDLLGEEAGLNIFTRRAALAEKQRVRLPARLHILTGEDRGREPLDWLAWWLEARSGQPVQVGPEEPPRSFRLRVIRGEPAGTDFVLDEGGVFPLGRDGRCALQLTNRSVSRLHATVMRLHGRLLIRDEGSRLGTVVNNQRRPLSFLDPGDEISLGEVWLLVEASEPAPTRLGLDLHAFDALTFDAVVEANHPAAATGLLGTLHEQSQRVWIDEYCDRLFPGDPDQKEELKRAVYRQFDKRVEMAERLLPQILGAVPKARSSGRTSRLAGWGQILAKQRKSLPPQVLPLGWLASTRGLYSRATPPGAPASD